MLLVWVFFLLYRNDSIIVNVISRFFAFLFAIVIAINSIVGEKWLDDSTFTLSTHNDGFALFISLLVLGLSIIIMYNAIVAFQSMRMDSKKREYERQ